MLTKLSSGLRVWKIGDPHLGRRFENGVPLDRRGEREARQWSKFKYELEKDCDINIMVGDLFDHPQVSMQTIMSAAQLYLDAAFKNPGREYYAMAGNHDRSRQLNTAGAWELFTLIVAGRRQNLHVIDEPFGDGRIVMFPWEWGKPVADQVTWGSNTVELVVLHHDLESFGGNTDYMVPAKLLAERFPNAKIVTGHWHLEGDYKIDGVDVACTGSLEPYTHAEDPDGEIYVSLTLEQLAALDQATLRDKAVRVFLRDGEELPVGLDCLQLTGKRVTELEADPEASVAEKLGAFDWNAILDEHLKDVPDYVREFIDERLVAA